MAATSNTDCGGFASPITAGRPARKMPAFSRLCLAQGIAVVVVGFPATPLIESRCRFCVSASHTIADLDAAAEKIAVIGEQCMLKYCSGGRSWRRPLPPLVSGRVFTVSPLLLMRVL